MSNLTPPNMHSSAEDLPGRIANRPGGSSASVKCTVRCLLQCIALFGLLTASATSATAQPVVTTEPAFPTVDQAVTIFFHADEGSGGLAGHTGDVYAHTGLITSESSTTDGCSGVDWQHVKTGWGENTPDTRLTKVGVDLYSLDITNIRSYYGAMDSNEEIYRLAFVFRSGEEVGGSYLEGKTAQGCDIFVDLQSDGLDLDVLAPDVNPLYPIIAEQDTSIAVTIAAKADTSFTNFELQVDGTTVVSHMPAEAVRADTLRYDLVLDAPGRVYLTAIAETASGTQDSIAFYVVRNPTSVDIARPTGLKDGITYNDNGTVTLSLFAPHKQYVYVIGAFTGWEVDTDFLMNRETGGADSTWFWKTLDLDPGTADQGFQYLVDGQLRVADPYSEKLLTEQDQYIPEATYSGLPAYPEGQTVHPISLLYPSKMDYTWQATNYNRPDAEELVVYELLLRDFLAAHDFATLIDTLDYLENLGVTAIELMPVTEFDGNISWGYNPSFHLAVDKYYGPARDLKQLVDEAHQRDMAIILDAVYNQVTGQSPLARLYNEGTYGTPTSQNPWLNVEARHPFNVFYDVNHESAATQYWLDRSLRYWLEEYRVDGFRFDLSKGFTQNHTSSYAAWDQYDASRIRLIKRMADNMWNVDDSAYVILEHFAEPSEEYELTTYGMADGGPGMIVWNNMNRAYSQSAMGYLSDQSHFSGLGATYPPNNNYGLSRRITYMESHDEQWLMFRNLAYGPSNAGYDVSSLPVALDRMKLVGAFFLTVPGPRMLWQFGELGYGYGENGEQCLRDNDGECSAIAPGRTSPKPIRWDYYDDRLRRKLYKTWAALLKMRAEHAVFTSPETEVDMRVGQGVQARRIRLSLDSMNVVIVGNFGTETTTINPQYHHPGTWYDFFESSSSEIIDVNAPISLSPGEFHVYTSQPVDYPEEGLITVGRDAPPSAGPSQFHLAPNYPNPFSGETTIRYGTSQPQHVTLAVYDVLGRRVRMLIDRFQPAGTYQVQFDARGLADGVYFCRLKSGERHAMRKMLILK